MMVGGKYNFEEQFNRKRDGVIVITIALVLLTFALLVSCKTLPPVASGSHTQTRDSVRTEYYYDSIYIDRWHTKWMKGDTVFIHDSIWRDRFKHDSIFIDKFINITDTIPVVVEVEKKGASFWKGSGIAFWCLIGILFIGGAVGLCIKFAK